MSDKAWEHSDIIREGLVIFVVVAVVLLCLVCFALLFGHLSQNDTVADRFYLTAIFKVCQDMPRDPD